MRIFSLLALPLVAGFGAISSAPAIAAPATLSFTVTARVTAKDEAGIPPQTVDAKVAIAGRKARLETVLGGKPLVLIYTPPHVYRLLPTSKVGQKYRSGSLPQLSNLIPGSDAFSPDPKAIRAGLVRGGAKKTGSTIYNGTPVDVYRATRFRNRPDNLVAYLRRSDALPLRLTLDSRSFSAVASWRDYKINQPLSVALFAVPKGYRIRNVDRTQ